MIEVRNERLPRQHAERPYDDQDRYYGQDDHYYEPRQSQNGYNSLKQPQFDHRSQGSESSGLSAELLIELPNGSMRRFKVFSPAVMIGRTQSADINIEYPAISRQHARLVQVNAAFWLMDLGSTNGTMVNGKYIESIRLTDGDLITLGADGEEPIYITIRIHQTNW